MNVQLELEELGERTAGPQVFSFAGGPPAPRVGPADLDVDLLAPAASGAPRKGRRLKPHARALLVVPTNHEGPGASVVYTGRNYGSRANRFAAQRFAVSVYDPASGRARLVPVPHLFRLRHHLSGHKAGEGSDGDEEEQEEATTAPGTYEERVLRKRELVETFGSRKKKRKMRSDAANEVDISAHGSVDAVAQALRTSATEREAAAGEDGDDAGMAAMRAKMLPPHNALAADAEEMYPVHGIVPEDVWESLDVKPLVRLARKPSLLDTEEGEWLPAAVRDRVEWLGGVGGKDAATGKARDVRPAARGLLYLTYMLQFYILHMRGGKGRGDGPRGVKDDLSAVGCEEFVAEHLVATFSEKSGGGSRHMITPALQNKLRCYICVLLMISSDFEIGVATVKGLAADLGITLTKCVGFFREVGAKMTGRGDARIVRLRAPLALPRLRKRAANSRG